MPSRPVIALILLFWAGTTGWLLSREVWPFLGAGEAPPYAIDITEQIGASPVRWNVLENGRKIGTGTSQIRRAEGRTFDIHADFKFDKLSLAVVSVSKVEGTYRVGEDGELLALSGEVHADLGPPKTPPDAAGKLKFSAVVQDGFLVPEFHASYLGVEMPPFEMDKAPLAEHGSLLNPMHPLNRLSGLRDGQRWRVPLFNPLSALVAQLGKKLPVGLPAAETSLPVLQAEVSADEYEWDGATVPCHKIEYREPGKEVSARTWVRRFDGLVLEQWAAYAGMQVALVRVPEK